LVMVSDGGQLIRMPVSGISFTGRTSRGVTLFKVANEERVVSVTRFRDLEGNGDEEPEDGEEGIVVDSPPVISEVVEEVEKIGEPTDTSHD
jgi:hypothetical protein